MCALTVSKTAETFERHGFTFQFIRKAIKNIHLRIHPNGNIVVSAPKNCRKEHVLQFIDAKQTWISQHCPQPLPSHLRWFLGKSYALSLHSGFHHPSISIDKEKIFCFLKSTTDIDSLEKHLQTFYKNEMQKLIPPLIKKWEAILNVQVHSWYIRHMKSRWGTCNTRQHRICLNLELMKKPVDCIEYVLVHEMVHLLEPSHNHRFHALMSQYLPNWPILKKNLQTSTEMVS